MKTKTINPVEWRPEITREAIFDAVRTLRLNCLDDAWETRTLFLDRINGGRGCDAVAVILEGTPSRFCFIIDRGDSWRSLRITDLKGRLRTKVYIGKHATGSAQDRASRVMELLFTTQEAGRSLTVLAP